MGVGEMARERTSTDTELKSKRCIISKEND